MATNTSIPGYNPGLLPYMSSSSVYNQSSALQSYINPAITSGAYINQQTQQSFPIGTASPGYNAFGRPISNVGGTSGTTGGAGGTSGTTGTPGLPPAVSGFLDTINSLLSGISKNLTAISSNLSSGGGGRGGISGGGISGISGGGQQSLLPG